MEQSVSSIVIASEAKQSIIDPCRWMRRWEMDCRVAFGSSQ